MKRIVLLVLMACLLAGCAAKLTMDQSGMIGPDGKYITVMSGTTRDRFGTDLQTQVWMDENGKQIAAFQGFGPGVGTTAMQGAVAGLEQAGGLIGAGALIRPTNISGGNASSTSASKSKAKTNQSQAQSQNQTNVQTQFQSQSQSLQNTLNPTNVNTNVNTFNPTNKVDVF